MIFCLHRKGAGAMCSCNSKNKDGSRATFLVTTAAGEYRTVNSEQEARAIVRISGGTYKKN
jgi:hypothetical protein